MSIILHSCTISVHVQICLRNSNTTESPSVCLYTAGVLIYNRPVLLLCSAITSWCITCWSMYLAVTIPMGEPAGACLWPLQQAWQSTAANSPGQGVDEAEWPALHQYCKQQLTKSLSQKINVIMIRQVFQCMLCGPRSVGNTFDIHALLYVQLILHRRCIDLHVLCLCNAAGSLVPGKIFSSIGDAHACAGHLV